MENKSSYRSKIFHIVIEEYDKLNDKHLSELDINNAVKEEMRISFYAFIKHDSDTDEDNNLKRIHYHICAVLNQPYSKNTIIHSLANLLNCNVDIISVRKTRSFISSIQYLIHKNDKDKYQYEYKDIWSNDYNEVNMCMYMNTSSYEVDIDYLFELVKKCSSLAEIYHLLGLEKSKRYRSIIMDMYREEHIERFL